MLLPESAVRLNIPAMHRILAAALVTLCLAFAALPTSAAPVILTDSAPIHDAWPQVRVLSDPQRDITIEDALRRLPDFAPPESPHAGMGFRSEALWFHVPVAVAADSDGLWILEIDYALLNRIDVYLVDRMLVRKVATVGSLMPYKDRPLG